LLSLEPLGTFYIMLPEVNSVKQNLDKEWPFPQFCECLVSYG
jgi:hypothetical protein